MTESGFGIHANGFYHEMNEHFYLFYYYEAVNLVATKYKQRGYWASAIRALVLENKTRAHFFF